MSPEKFTNNSEFEQNGFQEIERKFVPKNAELFEQWRSSAVDIVQMYLSNPEDDYSLRLRCTTDLEGNEKFSAATKSRGVVSNRGLERMEVETPISKKAFMHYFESNRYPVLFKKRAVVCEGVTIDWIEGSDTPIVEVENSELFEEASQFLSNFESELIERTGEPDVDNESLAHELSGRKIENEKTLSIDEIMNDALAYRTMGVPQLVIGIGGRSGSGKSTLARELIKRFEDNPYFQETPVLLSTDDYHLGRKHLEQTYGAPWTNWEDARTYDTKAASKDIEKLLAGESVQKRRFDFEKEEVVTESSIKPANIVILEGIHASSRDFADVRTMYYEVKTPVSTSSGRDLTRMMTTDRPSDSISTPQQRLKYIIETGEPTYQTIPSAPRNIFSASSRRREETIIQ